jgi:protein-S-isoprenylcysteine O-methyltransferase Ste14
VSDDGVAILPALGFGLQFGGVSLQIASKLWLGRSFGLLPARRALVTRGPYALVRHPMYLGYFMNHVGFLLQSTTPWNLGVYAALYVVQVLRIVLEERWLARDADYRAYMTRVRSRFLPGIW